MSPELYLLLADSLLVLHVLLVGFVIFGLAAIFIGHFLKWSWVRNVWFRVTHLVVIVIVVLQAWLGVLCPLTVWEMELRERAGAAGYEGSFIQHWLQSLLYYSAPEWVFILAYTAFGGVVLASWFLVRPGRPRK
ncbi:DUF2784 domain-containing protein [Marinobacter sp.]|uniref:DUF2784 domain-containing protein n=1 Tax=Marinobacter sp. TaxID=50741 RepID=UPI00356815FD